MKKREKKHFWMPKKVDDKELQSIADWLNTWGDFYKHNECLDDKSTINVGGKKQNNHITDFGRGYEVCISDVMDKMKLELMIYDKRTKKGYRKS